MTTVNNEHQNTSLKTSDKKSLFFPMVSMHLMTGYNFRAGNAVLGLDFRLSVFNLTPGLTAGYIFDNHHYLGASIGYNFMPRLIVGTYIQEINKAVSKQKESDSFNDNFGSPYRSSSMYKNTEKAEISSLSGIGGAIMYRYYTETKSMYGVEVRMHYYNLTTESAAYKNAMIALDPCITFTWAKEF
jgi:hypothetical protein